MIAFSRPLARHATYLHAEADVPGHCHVGIERIGLEHHGDVALGRMQVVHLAARDPDFAAGDGLEPAMVFSNVDLPQPEGPTSTRKPPSSISRSMPFSTSTAPNFFSN